MGWFTGKYEWVPAKAPVQLVVRISLCGTDWINDYDQDLVYTPGTFTDPDFADILSRTAEEQANSRAARIRKEGFVVEGVHYPVHRIQEIEVVPCKWVEVEKEVTTKVWEVQPA